jgi:hypothetical protein
MESKPVKKKRRACFSLFYILRWTRLWWSLRLLNNTGFLNTTNGKLDLLTSHITLPIAPGGKTGLWVIFVICTYYPQTTPNGYWMLTNVNISAMMRRDFTSSDEINAKKICFSRLLPQCWDKDSWGVVSNKCLDTSQRLIFQWFGSGQWDNSSRW